MDADTKKRIESAKAAQLDRLQMDAMKLQSQGDMTDAIRSIKPSDNSEAIYDVSSEISGLTALVRKLVDHDEASTRLTLTLWDLADNHLPSIQVIAYAVGEAFGEAFERGRDKYRKSKNGGGQ